GARSRSNPARMSATSVVADSTTDAPTERVALASTFHVPHRPGTDSDIPPTSTWGPWPTKGIARAKITKGISIERRLRKKPTGSTPARTPNAHTAWVGVAMTAATNVNRATILTSGASRWTGLWPW